MKNEYRKTAVCPKRAELPRKSVVFSEHACMKGPQTRTSAAAMRGFAATFRRIPFERWNDSAIGAPPRHWLVCLTRTARNPRLACL